MKKFKIRQGGKGKRGEKDGTEADRCSEDKFFLFFLIDLTLLSSKGS